MPSTRAWRGDKRSYLVLSCMDLVCYMRMASVGSGRVACSIAACSQRFVVDGDGMVPHFVMAVRLPRRLATGTLRMRHNGFTMPGDLAKDGDHHRDQRHHDPVGDRYYGPYDGADV